MRPVSPSALWVGFAAVVVTACDDATTRSPPATSFLAIDAGWQITCGVLDDNTLYCWTPRQQGEPVAGGKFVDVAGGCALEEDGSVHCVNPTSPWTVNRVAHAERFRDVFGSCGLTTSDTTVCWGEYRMPPRVIPARLVHASGAAGGGCGLDPDGIAICWGYNTYGQLGNGTTEDSDLPVHVDTDLIFEQISVGAAHTCATTAEGAAYCWGRNYYFELGIPGEARPGCGAKPHPYSLALDSLRYCTTPQRIPSDLRFEAIQAGNGWSCGLAEGGQAFCWGLSDSNVLGVASGSVTSNMCRIGQWYSCTPIPMPVEGNVTFTSLGTARSLHVCGLAADGDAYCWGNVNEDGTPSVYSGGLGTGVIGAVALPVP